MSAFEIFPSSGKFWFRLRANNNEIVLASEAYEAKASCHTGIAAVRSNCHSDRFEKFFAHNQYGFNQRAANGEIIGRSEKYTAAANRDHGLAIVIAEAPEAGIEDLT